MEVIITCYMPPIKLNNKNKLKNSNMKQLVKMSTTFQGKCHYNFMLQECNIRILYYIWVCLRLPKPQQQQNYMIITFIL